MAFPDELIDGVRVPHWTPDAPDAPRNFGDEIGPLLVRALLSAAPRQKGSARLLSVGSVLQFASPGDVVWGAGINGKVRQRVRYPLDVRSVRGPLTRAVLLGHGVRAPEVYGDPALLFPRLFPEVTANGAGGLTVVPNLNELDRVPGEDVLSPVGEPREIAARIAGSGFVVASSLHALVLADAYGIPSRPLVPAAEHPLKYLDYYAGTGRADVRFAATHEEALELGPVPPPIVDLDAIDAAFPRDLWRGGIARGPEDSRDYESLRHASAAVRDAVTRSVGQDVSASAAQALLRVEELVADQPAALTHLLERCSSEARPAADEIGTMTVRYLIECAPHGETDRRVSRALRRASANMHDVPVVARVAATGKVSLARAIARDERTEADGFAYLASLDLPAAPIERSRRRRRMFRRRD